MDRRHRYSFYLIILGTLRYEDGELGWRRGWMSKTRSGPVVPAKSKILKRKQFSVGTATAIFLSPTDMLTFKDARNFLLESFLVGVIDDDELILLYHETFFENPEFLYELLLLLLLLFYLQK